METSWPPRPVIYEINTWVWLAELSQQYQHLVTLGSVPPERWDAIASLSIDAVWLMGVWERSPEGIVPNHVAPDHPWVFEHPEYSVQGTRQDWAQAPEAFFERGTTVIARGRDPNFPAWPDVAQLNAFSPDVRQAAGKTMCSIAEQCEGIRCDMVMLLLNSVFERTWGARVGSSPPEEYWQAVISAVRAQYPNVLLLAETYWDLEWDMQQLGFDYCYDKRFYDRLLHDHAESVRLHLTASLDYQEKLVRFIENHDELRAAAVLQPEQERAAAVTMMTLPGAKLLYEGQLEGRRVRPPVFLARRPVEPIDSELQAFYSRLLVAVRTSGLSVGEWQLCERRGWPDNNRYLNLVAWCWSQGEEQYVVVVNLSRDESQARVYLPWKELARRAWHLTDVLSGEQFVRDGSEMQSDGLYVNLPAWKFYFLRFQSGSIAH